MPTIVSPYIPSSKPSALKQAVKDLARANGLYSPSVKVLCQYNRMGGLTGLYNVSLRLYYREGYSGRPTFRAVKVIHNTIPATPSSDVSYAYTFEDEKALVILRDFTAKAAAYEAQSTADSLARRSKADRIEALLKTVFGVEADIGGATGGDVTLSIDGLCALVSLRPLGVLDTATVADLRFNIGYGGYRTGLRNLTATAFQGIVGIIAGELAAGRLTAEDINL